MIPGTFDYHRPTTVGSAVALLLQLGEEARPLAGGHSLIPLMKTRFASPEHLVDLSGIEALRGIVRSGDEIVIGAMTTQYELIQSALLTELVPIIRETAVLIADPQIRYKGTLGGNCANGDPGNDMPARSAFPFPLPAMAMDMRSSSARSATMPRRQRRLSSPCPAAGAPAPRSD